MLKYFLLFSSVIFFTSCLDNGNYEPAREYPTDRFTENRTSSVRCNGSGNSSRGGDISISKSDDISSNNAGEYRVSGHCERSNEPVQISVENKSLEKMCSGGRWSATLDVTSVVQRQDTVSISVSSSGSSACVAVDNRFNCPEGYIPVPRLTGYTERDFCVMEYEASSEYRRDDRYSSGRYGSSSSYGSRYGGGSSYGSNSRYGGYGNSRSGGYYEDDEYYFDRAISRSGNDPWTEISHGEAQQKCQNNGIGYNLITNDDWQTIARHIESEHFNWSEGRAVVRANNILNVGVALTGAYGSSRRGGSSSRWEIQKRTHSLPNAEEIWDFSGGVWELVSDTVSALGIRSEGNKNISELSGENKRLFGPKSNYNSLSDRRSTRETPGGLGHARLSSARDYVARGGGSSERDLGVFSVRADIDSNRSGSALRGIGFRCIFRP
ncbi:MAG: SUMF1/EgtB/PvdO family nonheme iron enzyme [Bdellovibrionales bacterium]|nr:SUMF1/EgtB/PvdO family nonheme iron enzyme [Bdellovibrionales bacterium]